MWRQLSLIVCLLLGGLVGTAVRFYAHQQCSEVNGCGVHLSLAQSLDRMSELAYEKMREGNAYTGFQVSKGWEPEILTELPNTTYFLERFVRRREPVIFRLGDGGFKKHLGWRTELWKNPQYLMNHTADELVHIEYRAVPGREKEFLDAQEAFDGKGEIDFTVVDGTDEDDAQLTAINEMYSDEAVRTSFDNPLSSLITSDPRFANPTERVGKFGYDPLDAGSSGHMLDFGSYLDLLLTRYNRAFYPYLNMQLGVHEKWFRQSASSKAVRKHPVLAGPAARLSTDYHVPPFYSGSFLTHLNQINFWLGSTSPNQTAGAASALHRDGKDNLYAVVSGQKRFLLYSPADAGKVYLQGNHKHTSHLGQVSMKRDFNGGNFARTDPDIAVPEEQFPLFHEARPTYAHLQAGDLFYLPTGWFHLVTSTGFPHMALNFWALPPLECLREHHCPPACTDPVSCHRGS